MIIRDKSKEGKSNTDNNDNKKIGITLAKARLTTEERNISSKKVVVTIMIMIITIMMVMVIMMIIMINKNKQ